MIVTRGYGHNHNIITRGYGFIYTLIFLDSLIKLDDLEFESMINNDHSFNSKIINEIDLESKITK